MSPFYICVADPRGRLEQVWADCGEADPGVFQLVLGWQDGSLMSVTPRGNIMFLREEGLSAIHTAQMVVKAVQDDGEVGLTSLGCCKQGIGSGSAWVHIHVLVRDSDTSFECGSG